MNAYQIKYCTRCVMPETKPDLSFDEQGVCAACKNYEHRKEVDWHQREQQLITLFNKYRAQNGSNWDCIIPVSGGKDSTYQVIKVLQYGMRPLCVIATTCDLSEIGRKNIENIKRLGVDCIEFSANPLVRKKLNRIGLSEVGDISWPEHVAIFTQPIIMAVRCNVPLIIWGENSQNEYGGPAADAHNNYLTRRWLEEFGGLLGLRVADLEAAYGFTQQDLLPYVYPSDEDLKRVGVTGLFLGHYLPWDGHRNALLAEANGFTVYPQAVEGSIANYENLDNHQTGIHDYFKFLKFGFSRASDICSLHVRRQLITRAEALALVKKRDGKFPWTYLGKPLSEILAPLDLSVEEFTVMCDQFTNKKLFKCDANGHLLKDRQGNLTKINDDNV
jgi:N-acetyl sugar amidotransferase